MGMPTNENILLQETNKGGYTLAIVARFVDPYPVQYIIRLSKPDGTEVDYMSTLEEFFGSGKYFLYFPNEKIRASS